MQEDKLIINEVEIKKGERRRFNINIAKLYDTTQIKIPIEVIKGKKDGPTIFITAAIHGDEINGVETIRRFLSRRKILSDLRGTVIAMPIVNAFGFNRRSRYFPDRRDLNRSFPGNKNGSLTSQVANILVKEIIVKCQYGIDLHTGGLHRFNLPQIRVHDNSPEMIKLAKQFKAPIVLRSHYKNGSLRKEAEKRGVKILLFEGGEALRHDKKVIIQAEKGIFSVLYSLKMLDQDPSTEIFKKRSSVYMKSSYWVRSPYSGSLYTNKSIGNKVKKGEVLGFISDPFRDQKYYLKAKCPGIIVGITTIPLIGKGDALFNIAIYDDTNL